MIDIRKAGLFDLAGHSINRMGYGAMQLAGPAVFGPPKDHAMAVAVLRAAIASGVNHIDTSDFYGPHVTNQIICEALHPYPEDLVIVTKVSARRGADGSWLPAMSPKELTDAIHDNLRHLKLDVLDIVNLRSMFSNHAPMEGSLEEPLTVLADLQRSSPLKGIAMTVLGLLFGIAGTDINTAEQRFTFGILHMADGIEIVALALGIFGIAEFLKCVNYIKPIAPKDMHVSMRDMLPSREELKTAFPAMWRGTFVGSLCALIPGTGPTIASFVAYALEKKITRTPERFGHGAVEGVASPEASTHSSVQGDFIPTMSLGIPGDAVMALILGALIIQGITPGPQLVREHPDLFWGLIASFWIGNILLIVLNVPLIGIWVKLLTIPYRYLYPSAIFFICIGVYSTTNDLFGVGETLVIGLFGYILLMLGFHPAPMLLGFVLGPRFEENFRRAMLISDGDLGVFIQRPISASFLAIAVMLLVVQFYVWAKKRRANEG